MKSTVWAAGGFEFWGSGIRVLRQLQGLQGHGVWCPWVAFGGVRPSCSRRSRL